MTTTQTPARIEFSPRWDANGNLTKFVARPVGEGTLMDRTYDEPVQSGGFICSVSIEQKHLDCDLLVFWVTTQGKEPGGRRYRQFTDSEAAFQCAEKWAARRFFYRAEAAK